MTRKHLPPDDPQAWLDRARSALAHAQAVSAEVFYEDLCFDAQQAAEKAIKAVFISRGERFPYIHDLEGLLRLLSKQGVKIPKYVWDADTLTTYAAFTRYPVTEKSVAAPEYRRAVRIATAVVRWAERQVERA